MHGGESLKTKFLADLEASMDSSRRAVDLLTNWVCEVLILANGREVGAHHYRAVIIDAGLRAVDTSPAS